MGIGMRIVLVVSRGDVVAVAIRGEGTLADARGSYGKRERDGGGSIRSMRSSRSCAVASHGPLCR